MLSANSQAKTRYDYVKAPLQTWVAQLPSDDLTALSLVTPQDILVQDASPADWTTVFEGLDPDFSAQQADTQTLQQALSLATGPGQTPGMGAAIWWITAEPSAQDIASMEPQISELKSQGIPIFIWEVGAPLALQSNASQNLKGLAESTGGQWLGFSSAESFPNPEDYFRPFRTSYSFQYKSQLHTAGTHQIQLQIQAADFSATSEPLSFDLNIQPPNPILASPPSQIQRGPSDADPQQLAPFTQPIEIQIEFPDNFQRDVVRTTLYVNDQSVAENRSAPFTHFAWDLTGYTSSQQVTLRVEAEDSLGLVGSSIDYLVDLSVTNPPSLVQGFLSRRGPWLALGGVALAAVALFLVMVLSGQLKPPQLGKSRRPHRRQRAAPTSDPLVDSPITDELVGASALELGGTILAREQAPAILQRLNMQVPGEVADLVPLRDEELFIGSATENSIVLTEESVSPRHAHVSHLDDGTYLVADLGSEAGTWVNYAPVSPEGSQLRDGDLLHIGRVAFRFLLNLHEDSRNE